MAGSGPLHVAIVGCGNISNGYASTMAAHPDKINLVGAFDLDRSRAEWLTGKYGGKPYDTLDALLADPQIELVINLTIQKAHVEVITRALEAGKHVLTEKPITVDPAAAKKLVALAKKKKLRFSSAPTTFLGEAQQTAWKVVRDGRLGTVRVAYAEMNWGRIETWHPQPQSFYDVGAMFDVGVYPLTILTMVLGSVTRVDGFGKIVSPERRNQAGEPFAVQSPDWTCGVLQFESGPVARVTTSFYVGPSMQQGIEFHGDAASLFLAQPHEFASPVRIRDWTDPHGPWQDVPPVKEPYRGVDWARGVVDLYEAIRNDRPHRATAEQAAHVVEVIAGIHNAADTGRAVTIKSRFTPPEPMEWAK